MLNKTDFRNYIKCKNEFWLYSHFPELKPAIALKDQLRREAGYEVEAHAKTLATLQGPNVETGTEFQTATLYAKADIVATDQVTGEIDIYEVKSGTEAKEEYQQDLAFQCYVARQAGFVVRRASLIIVNNTYLFDGNLDVDSLLRITDETETVNALQPAVTEQVGDAQALLAHDEPVVTLNDYCKANKLECSFIMRHFPDIPEFNVSHIFNAGTKKLTEMLNVPILHVRDIPADFKMTDIQSAIVAVERSGQTYIDSGTIKGEIDGLIYPLNFLDYESFNPAVPKFAHTRPYQQMVFQYSLHTMDEPGGDLRHSYHLSRNDGRHPTEEIVERLYEDLNGRIGTIIIWSEGFEKTRNTEIGEMYPDYAPFLAELNENVYDLRKVFSRRLYMHPEFRGRDSIKKVLPVITDLSYEGMDIADGLTASIKWYHAATGRGTQEDRDKTFRDLEAYCHLDTLAMVEIYKHLLTI